MSTRALMVLAACMVESAASAECGVGRIAELPVTMSAMQPMTDVVINGRTARFMIDSGAFFSVITPGNAKALNLHTEAMPGWMLRGINGETGMSVTTVKSFGIAGAQVPNVQFIVAGSEMGGAGVLGQNLLGLADAEYDLPHGAVRLMRAKGCASNIGMAYWAAGRPFSMMNIMVRDQGDPHTIGTITLNGVPIKATFDTGASESVLSMAAAARAGITPRSPGVEPGGIIVGFGRKLVRTWIAPFDSLKIGDQEEIRHGRIRFGETTDGGDMLLGADFFIAHRVYVSNTQHRLYLTYEGGPVFSLQTHHQDQSGAAIAAEASRDDPSTAEGYSRAGAVRLAQHDRDGAIADFDKAIALAPTEPRYLLQRAGAALDAGRKEAASTDIAAAIRLKPDDVEALLARAGLELDADKPDPAAVLADIDAADRAAAPAADERLAIGGLYEAAEQPGRAVAQYDLWVRNHPDDVRRPEALNDRCWARALAGIELPAALSDCNAALRQRPGAIAILDSRGMVELRMGDLDKAIRDYDMVLKAQPKMAWSLYGRGIARRRKGDVAGGEADLAASAAMAPELALRAKGYGIVP
jgi:tetratricopeptide (TPR) repeat protein